MDVLLHRCMVTAERAARRGLSILVGLVVAAATLPDDAAASRYLAMFDQSLGPAVFGTPTMHARHDLAQHFAFSAALVVLVGPQGTEGIGILKNLSDSRGGSGFSFVDLSADLSGLFFATAVSAGKIPLSRLEDGFAVADFLPEPTGLKEGIGWNEFVSSYGYPPDNRLFQERESLQWRILTLPGYKWRVFSRNWEPLGITARCEEKRSLSLRKCFSSRCQLAKPITQDTAVATTRNATSAGITEPPMGYFVGSKTTSSDLPTNG